MADWNETATTNGHDAGLLGDDPQAQIQAAMDQAREQVEEFVETATAFVKERPVVCLAGAVALGFLVGKLASRR